MNNTYRSLIRGAQREEMTYKPSRRLEDEIKIHLKDNRFKGVTSTHVTLDMAQWLAHVYVTMNLQVSQKAEAFFCSVERLSAYLLILRDIMECCDEKISKIVW
jgi:hypothetical protein